MAISILNQSDEIRNATVGTTETYNHTVSSGSNTLLLVMLTAQPEESGVTFDLTWDVAGANESLTEIGSGHVDSNDALAHAYYLINPTPAVSSLTVVQNTTFTGATSISIVQYTLAGVDQSTPIRDENGDADDVDVLSTGAVTTVSGDFLSIACVQENDGTLDYDDSTFTVTLVQDNDKASSDDATYHSGYGTADAVTETGEVNSTSTDHTAIQLVALIPAAVSSSSSSSSLSSSSSSSSESSSSSSSSSSLSSSSSSSSSLSSSSSTSFSSSSSATPGTKVWGQQNGTEEDYQNPFTGNWTTSGGWYPSGSGDSETLITSAGECEQTSISNPHYLGSFETIIFTDKYNTGTGPLPEIYYKTATTKTGLSSESWTLYNGVSFTSVGWVKLKVIHTCDCALRITENLNQRVTEGDVGTLNRKIE